jgi:hypothetical protein
MKIRIWILFVACLAALPTRGQVTISASDLFNQPGQYYLAYSNPYDLTGASSTNFVSPPPYTVPPNLIGSAGPNQIWDFSTGPTNVIYRFDYLSITNPAVRDPSAASDFPQATVVEQQTDQTTGEVQDLFFSQDPVRGRTVYGFYAENQLFDNTVNSFNQPIDDFPNSISYLQTWQTSATWLNSVFGIGTQVTQSSLFTVDAYGTIKLPSQLGTFGSGLRVKEVVTQLTYFDDGSGSGYTLEETDNTINYYWMMPGRGIVASLASTPGQNGQVPPDNFSTATQFWRMFQTNHQGASSTGGGCTSPQPVTDLTILVSNGQALLSWSKASCASQYRLDYSANPSDPTSWKPLTTVTNQLLVLDTTGENSARFYRVVSIK